MSDPLENSKKKIPNRRTFMAMAFATQGGILVLAILFGWIMGERFWHEMHFNPRAFAIGIAFSLPLVIAAIASAQSASPIFRQIRNDFDVVVQLFKDCTILDLFVISILAGLGEEALFRGVLQPYFAHWTNPAIGIILAALIFALLHFISRIYVLLVFIIGLYLGALYLYFDNLLIPITTHAAYDFLALLYATRLRANPT